MSDLTPFAALTACQIHLTRAVDQDYARLFVDEHVAKLARRLAEFQDSGIPDSFPPPHFAAECTPPLATAWECFRQPMQLWHSADHKLAPAVLTAFAQALAAAGTKSILVLLGQRLTSASVTDGRAFPPASMELLKAAAQPHLPGERLSVAARALTKHVHRSTGEFWGEVTGSAEAKNQRAVSVLQTILAGTTWWNVFEHFQHELVFEARVPSGQGARWNCAPLEFIGFLEPFDGEQCPSLRSDLDPA